MTWVIWLEASNLKNLKVQFLTNQMLKKTEEELHQILKAN